MPLDAAVLRLKRSSKRNEHSGRIGSGSVEDAELFGSEELRNVIVAKRDQEGDDDGEPDTSCREEGLAREYSANDRLESTDPRSRKRR